MAAATFLLGASGARSQYTVLHEFIGGGSDGRDPRGSLTAVGGVLYGTTQYGGDADLGTVFSIDIDDADVRLVHEFAGTPGGGAQPWGSLTADGSTLYGTTTTGGSSDLGTVFKVGTNGQFVVVHHFTSGAGDGGDPEDSLVLAGSTLYGTTQGGGGTGKSGTVFKVNTDGSGFGLLYEFAGGSGDGASPIGSPTLIGSVLYGTTAQGGDANRGTIFKVNAGGGGFDTIHEFVGGDNDGREPWGAMIAGGSVLYGTTRGGGTGDIGTIFKIDTADNSYQIVHDFAGGSGGGKYPLDALLLVGSTLYGTTEYGGEKDQGTLFRVSTDGSGFQILHTFAGGITDGSRPHGALTLVGSTLYGTTAQGGDTNGGTVFSYAIPEPASAAMVAGVGAIALLIRRRIRRRRTAPPA
jgi:uncharacterized repeat protein (TIGR03803 family)